MYKNKEDQANASRSHYEKYRDTIIANSKKTKKVLVARNKKYVQDYLSTHYCVDCGEMNPIVLEFDHVRDVKLANVSELTAVGGSLKKLQEEMDKCDIRCANCHRLVTYKRRNGIL